MNRHPEYISPARQRVLRVLNGVVVLLLISLVLQVAGCASPGWLYMTYGSSGSVHFGLWYVRVCGYDTCLTKSTSYFDEAARGTVSDNFGLNEYRGETISAIAFCFAAIVVLRFSRTRLYIPNSNNVMAPLGIGGVFILITGILATAAAGKFGDKTREAADIINAVGSDNPIKFPYSLFITGVGGLLGLIAFLVLLVSQPWKISTENQQSPPHAPQPVTYPAQFTTTQTAYPQGQPQVYAMATAPDVEKSASAPSYY